MTALHTLAALPAGINAYSEAGARCKARMHSSGHAWLRFLAADLCLEPGTFDIRSNQGGIAVSGKVTLHADHLYVQLSESFASKGGVSVLYRRCESRKDYSGWQNHFASMQWVEGNYSTFLAACKFLLTDRALQTGTLGRADLASVAP